MKDKVNFNRIRTPKGKRANWKPLKEDSGVQLTFDQIQSRIISSVEIIERQHKAGNGKRSALVP